MANVTHSVQLFTPTPWNILLWVQFSHSFFGPALNILWVDRTVLLPSSFSNPIFSKIIQMFPFPHLKFPHDLETSTTINSVALLSKLTQWKRYICSSNVLLLFVSYLLLG